MTKADIVRQVSENTGIDKKEVGAVIESFMENVRESLCKFYCETTGIESRSEHLQTDHCRHSCPQHTVF